MAGLLGEDRARLQGRQRAGQAPDRSRHQRRAHRRHRRVRSRTGRHAQRRTRPRPRAAVSPFMTGPRRPPSQSTEADGTSGFVRREDARRGRRHPRGHRGAEGAGDVQSAAEHNQRPSRPPGPYQMQRNYRRRPMPDTTPSIGIFLGRHRTRTDEPTCSPTRAPWPTRSRTATASPLPPPTTKPGRPGVAASPSHRWPCWRRSSPVTNTKTGRAAGSSTSRRPPVCHLRGSTTPDPGMARPDHGALPPTA